MVNYVWPIVLVIFLNVVYQICAKSVPKEMNPFASLTVTYFIGAVTSAVLYFVLGRNANLVKEYSRLNKIAFFWRAAFLVMSVYHFLRILCRRGNFRSAPSSP